MGNPGNVGFVLDLRLKVDQLLLAVQIVEAVNLISILQIEIILILLHEIMTREGRNKQQQSCLRKSLLVATWIMRSLVESAGAERIRMKRPQEALSNLVAVDHKLDFLTKELKQYRLSIGAIQEMKWFGSDKVVQE